MASVVAQSRPLDEGRGPTYRPAPMRRTPRLPFKSASVLVLVMACGSPNVHTDTANDHREARPMTRLRFNQLAMRLDLPLFWAEDSDDDQEPDPDEIRSLLFYPSAAEWVHDGAFTDAFRDARAAIEREDGAALPDDARYRAIVAELGAAAPTLVETDLSSLPEDHRAFAHQMLEVARAIDHLYARQVGMTSLAANASPPDPPSRAVFRRNWGPKCEAPETESLAACSAIPGAPPEPVDIYPAELQEDDEFCATLEARTDKETLLAPFVAVREHGGDLVAVPYHEVYGDEMRGIATQLRAAADALHDPNEEPLRVYLRAAAESFLDDDWERADEAWSHMSATNSAWYVRVGPDEVYWDPCSRKAGFHLTLALIDRASLEWQERLTPLQNDMEHTLAALVADAYHPREVRFKMPDFISIVVNAGDDRDAFGATIGQSLPNWGRVADESRGRTVAMTNLYEDPDSIARRRETTSTLFSASAMEWFTDSPTPGLLATILHEATHNLGPAHEYRVNGRTSAEAFGGEMESMLEELKAQTGALYLLTMLKDRGVIDDAMVKQSRVDSIAWAFGHVARGMYTPDGHRKAYSQLAAIQLGFLRDEGALVWDDAAPAANGSDHGAYTIDHERLGPAVEHLMHEVLRVLATQDVDGANALVARHVDGTTVPQAIIADRFKRQPRATFVYAVQP